MNKVLTAEEIPEPIGAFILNQKDIKGTDTPNGRYYHYSEVCTLLDRLEAYKNQPSVSDEEIENKAKLLADEAWRMLPDTCKNIMGESIKKTFTESLTEDIIYQFKK